MVHTDLPILNHPIAEPAVFRAENLLARASEMMGKEHGHLPACCVLDFDGELAAVAREDFRAAPCPTWPCFHTTMLCLGRDGFQMGLIPGTVGTRLPSLLRNNLSRVVAGISSATVQRERWPSSSARRVWWFPTGLCATKARLITICLRPNGSSLVELWEKSWCVALPNAAFPSTGGRPGRLTPRTEKRERRSSVTARTAS